MPKQKELLNLKKRKAMKKSNEAPQSENEFLAAGVDFEEAGEKWRAGDAEKSLRFFMRATETYEAGLQRFPRSFDLAYNKARLQYDVAQQPRLLKHLPTPLLGLLRTALDSHRFALKIQQDNPDLLFNIAQVLTSLGEAVSGDKQPSEADSLQSLHYLQEALELFQRCLSLQEFQHNQAKEEVTPAAEALADDGDLKRSNPSGTSSDPSEEEVWAYVEEPITRATLLDTALAQLDTLTILCTLSTSQGHGTLAWIEEYYCSTLKDKINIYLRNASNGHEATLAKAKFLSALSDAAFQIGRLDFLTYERELTAAFAASELRLVDDPRGLCDQADAELAFTTSIRAASGAITLPAELYEIAKICWKHITKALDCLTDASKLPDALDIPRIHLRRGDCEMLRLRLGHAPLNYDLAMKSMPTLLKNAEVYYHRVVTLAMKSEDYKEERDDAEIKAAVAVALGGDVGRLSGLVRYRCQHVETTVEEMKEEDLLGEESLRKLKEVLM